MTLELYVLRQLLVGLVFSVGGMLLVAIPGIMVSAVQQLGGASMGVVVGFLPIVIMGLLPYLVPVGFLLTTVATYGRLAADNEWTAMVMAGIHPLRAVAPAAVIAFVLAAPLHWVMTDVMPTLTFAKQSYTKSAAVRVMRTMSPGKTELRVGDFYLSARSRDTQARNRFEHVFIHVPASDKDPAKTLIATTADFEFEGNEMIVDLVGPRFVSGGHDTLAGRLQLRSDLDQFFHTKSKRESWKYQSSSELARWIERTREALAKNQGKPTPDMTQEAGFVPVDRLDVAVFELHTRDTVAASMVMFLVLGVATGLLLQSGSMLGALATAVGYALVYYLLAMRAGKALAVSGAVPQWVAAWAMTAAGTLVGIALLFKALRR